MLKLSITSDLLAMASNLIAMASRQFVRQLVALAYQALPRIDGGRGESRHAVRETGVIYHLLVPLSAYVHTSCYY